MAFETTRCVRLSKIVVELTLEKLFYLDEHDDVKIETSDINRPDFSWWVTLNTGTDRIQIFGKVEMTYLEELMRESVIRVFVTFFLPEYHVWFWQGEWSPSERWWNAQESLMCRFYAPMRIPPVSAVI